MTVLDYLENTVTHHGNKAAIFDEHGNYTFSELRNKALSIAAAITKKTAGIRKSPIMVYLPKGKECISSFLGILYSGNFYTPTDVRFPFHKVQSIIDVLNPVLYISNAKCAENLITNGISSENMLIYDDVTPSNIDVNYSLSKIIDTDLAYVLFTSGSTGMPKGVTISHRGIMDYIDWSAECYNVTEHEIIANQVPLYFDMSVKDIYLCLKTGAQMHIIPEKLFSFPTRLVDYLIEKQINFIYWVPSALNHIANHDALKNKNISGLKKVLFAGEVMSNKQLNYWRSHLPDALYSNLYGPTEITVIAIYYIFDRDFDDDEPMPIGIPCKNMDILLLDEDNNLVTKQDDKGEICVRGSALSYGYWNNPEKTEEVFCQNPINPHYPEKIYRTGDLAHYNSRGEIMFDGRKDFQIKHLGYRIELGEIETVSMSLEGLKTVSTDYDTVNNEIVLFYSGELENKEVQIFLLKQLPKYMVPTRYIKLDEFPYNANGKIDRVKLKERYLEVK